MAPGPHRQIVPALAALAAVLSLAACQKSAPKEVNFTEEELALIGSLSPIGALPASPTNRFANDPDAAKLGHRLFFDVRLSQNQRVSCATCHVPALYFTDGKAAAEGVQKTSVHTPTIIGSHWAPFLFWDGRTDSSWSQALDPLEDSKEHGITRLEVARTVFAHHRAEYRSVFGELPPLDDTERFPPRGRPHPLEPGHPENLAWGSMTEADRLAVNTVFANAGKAMEAYTRKLLPKPAPFDDYVAALKQGDAKGGGHLTPAAVRGLRAFVSDAQCVNCHHGPLLTDFAFHNVGLPGVRALGRSKGAAQVLGDPFNCAGAFSDAAENCAELTYLDPSFEDFRGAFKTPSLRNVAKTAPYMHTGQFADLTQVVDFYKSLPGKPQIGHRELVLTLVSSDVSTDDLIAFLDTLTGPLPAAEWTTPPKDLPQ